MSKKYITFLRENQRIGRQIQKKFQRLDAKICRIESNFDLSSDHSPIILNLHSNIQMVEKPVKLFNRKTNWDAFGHKLNDLLDLHISLKNEEELDVAVLKLTQNIQEAAWAATPDYNKARHDGRNLHAYHIKEMINLKRKIRQRWQSSRSASLKNQLNQLTKTLKYEILD